MSVNRCLLISVEVNFLSSGHFFLAHKQLFCNNNLVGFGKI